VRLRLQQEEKAGRAAQAKSNDKEEVWLYLQHQGIRVLEDVQWLAVMLFLGGFVVWTGDVSSIMLPIETISDHQPTNLASSFWYSCEYFGRDMLLRLSCSTTAVWPGRCLRHHTRLAMPRALVMMPTHYSLLLLLETNNINIRVALEV
jgi:hypothetical protein